MRASLVLILALGCLTNGLDTVDLEGFSKEDPFSLFFLSSSACVKNESIGIVLNVPADRKVRMEIGYHILGDPDLDCEGGDSCQFVVADHRGNVLDGEGFALCGDGQQEGTFDARPSPWTLTVLYMSLECYEDTGLWGTIYPADRDEPPFEPYFGCGGEKEPAASSRIVGGTDADPQSIPWQVGLVRNVGSVFCGGSLISPHHVLTAAHCLKGMVPSSFSVWVGGHNVTRMEDEGDLYNVSCISLHPKYDWSLEWDFAMLTLASPVRIEGDSPARTVCLNKDASHENRGDVLTASGWGDLEYLGGRPQVLQQVDVTVRDCFEPSEELLCASSGGQQIGETCHGDSGGPVTFASEDGKTTLAGVVSLTYKCGTDEGKPAGYAKISAALAWILEQRIYDPEQPNRCQFKSKACPDGNGVGKTNAANAYLAIAAVLLSALIQNGI